MAYAYKKGRHSKNQLNLKKPRTPISAYRYAITTKNVVLWVIVAATAVVLITILCSFLLNPERRVHSDFETLAHNYYENVFYQDLITSENFDGNLSQALDKYSDVGLTRITLRQLSLISPNISADFLLDHCDENATYVIFYPESPYSRTSYHADYTYSCNF